MIDHSLDEFIFQLTEAHSLLNHLLFHDQLKKIKISVERPKRTDSSVMAFLQSGGNLYNGDEAIITIKTKSLNGDFFDLMNTLVHEMIHQYCEEHGLQSTYPTNPRHNKNFRDVGLKVGWGYFESCALDEAGKARRKRYGFAFPDYYTDEYRLVINNLAIDQKLIRSFVHDDAKLTLREKKVFHTYQCQGCGLVIRNQAKLNLMCLDCNLKLVKVK